MPSHGLVPFSKDERRYGHYRVAGDCGPFQAIPPLAQMSHTKSKAKQSRDIISTPSGKSYSSGARHLHRADVLCAAQERPYSFCQSRIMRETSPSFVKPGLAVLPLHHHLEGNLRRYRRQASLNQKLSSPVTSVPQLTLQNPRSITPPRAMHCHTEFLVPQKMSTLQRHHMGLPYQNDLPLIAS